MRLAAPAADEARHVQRGLMLELRKTRTGHCRHIVIKVQILDYDTCTVACFNKFEIINCSSRYHCIRAGSCVACNLPRKKNEAVDVMEDYVHYVRSDLFFFLNDD